MVVRRRNLAAGVVAAFALAAAPGTALAAGSHSGHGGGHGGHGAPAPPATALPVPAPHASGHGGHGDSHGAPGDSHGDSPGDSHGDSHGAAADAHGAAAGTGPDTLTRVAVIAGFGAVNAGIMAAAAAAQLRRLRVRRA